MSTIHNSILREFEGLGLFQAPRYIESSPFNGVAALEGEVFIAGRKVILQLVLDASFPLVLPRFFLQPWNALGFIPHIDKRGSICFADPEGLVLDSHKPKQIVQEAFDRVTQLLTNGVMGQNRADFADEFESYWRQIQGIIEVTSMLNSTDEVAQVIVTTDKERRLTLAGTREDIATFYNSGSISKPMTVQNALYLPLEPEAVIVPPQPNSPFWTVEEIRQLLLPALSIANTRRLQRLLKTYQHINEYIIVKLSRPSGGATLFGIQYTGVGEKHPLLSRGTARQVVPLHLKRLDRNYVIQRGGGNGGLHNKRVLLVGCGAVGGHLAVELVRAGVLNLTLVDPDTIIPENSFRHLLGRRYWNRKKVEALKEEIEEQLPYAQVSAVANTIEEALALNAVRFNDYDMVVFALGNPTVELEMNERIHALQNGPCAMFTWLEPLNIGGHALLTRNGSDAGCFQCLYAPREGEKEILYNRAAFAAPEQSFGRALSGCGSLYTPYGSVDAVQTAVLATRLAVASLSGREKGSPLLSWKGDATTFLDEGFRLSPRYRASEEERYRYRYAYATHRCSVCGQQNKRDV